MMGQRCLLCPKTSPAPPPSQHKPTPAPPPPSHKPTTSPPPPHPHGPQLPQHVQKGTSEGHRIVELVQPIHSVAKKTLQFIYKILDWDVKQGPESTLCFCNECASIFNSVVSLYIKLQPLLDQIKKNCKESEGFEQEPMGQPGFNLDLDQDSIMTDDLSKSPTCQSIVIPIKVEVGKDIQEEMEVEMLQNHFHWEDALSSDYEGGCSTTTSPSPRVDPLEVDANELSSNTGDSMAGPSPPLIKLTSQLKLSVGVMMQDSVPLPVFTQASTTFNQESSILMRALMKNSTTCPADLGNLHNTTQTSSSSKSIPNEHTPKSTIEQCSICDVFFDKEELEIHMLETHTHRIWVKPYNCPFCQKQHKYKSDSPDRWWRHIKKKHLGNLIHCDVCDEHFANTTVFEAHKVGHGVNSPVICSICGENSPSRKSFHQHLIYSHTATEWKKQKSVQHCEFCDREFRTPKGFEAHKCRSDKEQRKLSCEFCDMSFLWKKTLLKHLHKVHEVDLNLEKKHKCTICEKMFVSSVTLQQHETLHRKFDANDINAKCDICNFSPENHEKLVQHFEEVHMNQEQPRPKTLFKKCTAEDCNYNVSGWKQLKRHERKHHPYLLVHQCQLCEKRYSTPDFLETHGLTHGDGPFDCRVCHRGKCKSAKKLAEHLSRHNGEDNFKCDKCFETFSERMTLRKHKIRKHDEASPYECIECGKKFTQKHALEEHKARHDPLQDAVKFHCDVCPQVFNTKRHLASHVRKVHLEKPDRSVYCEICGLQVKRPFMLKLHILRAHSKRNDLEAAKKKICYFCDKKFLLCGELTFHMRTHTKERPYICKICHKDFTQEHCLKKHLKLHQQNETFFPKLDNLESLVLLPEIPQMSLSQYLS